MLVLSRRRDEKIFICNKEGEVLVTVTTVNLQKDKVRLGFDADEEYVILRKEVYDEQRTSTADQS